MIIFFCFIVQFFYEYDDVGKSIFCVNVWVKYFEKPWFFTIILVEIQFFRLLKGLVRALLVAWWRKQIVKQLTLWPKNMWKIIFKNCTNKKAVNAKRNLVKKTTIWRIFNKKLQSCEFLKKIPKNINKKNLKLHKFEKFWGIRIWYRVTFGGPSSTSPSVVVFKFFCSFPSCQSPSAVHHMIQNENIKFREKL
jgi:hypothetical protein